jgi:hypothetical protein
MEQPLSTNQRGTATPYPLPAPTGGWNARDSITNMSPKDALQLDNMFPDSRDVTTRLGSLLFATLPADVHATDPHNVRSLMAYNALDGTSKLFAGCEDGIYEATAGGAISTVSSVCTNGEWQHTMVSTAGGTFLWCCNGVDNSRYYTGSAWVVLTGVSTPAITGIVSTAVTNVSAFKTRLILCEKDSLSFWYLGVNSVSGAATEFPLGALFPRGGYLVATGTWTIDGGNGPDDYFVAITSEGEVAVYQGTDPASAATWALKGIYFIGTPLGKRCFVKLGGELAVQTVHGLYPMSKALGLAGYDRSVSISDKIDSAWISATSFAGDAYGWQPLVFPEGRFLLVNVPLINDQAAGVVISYQYVMNTQTKAWCRFTGLNAEVWGMFNKKLYYAVHNKIYQAWVGDFDEATGPIDARARQAFFVPGAGRTTQVKMIQPLFEATSANVQVQMGIDTNYDPKSKAYSSVTFEATTSLWDVAEWDEAKWTGSLFSGEWRSVAHEPGQALSVRLRFLGRGVKLTWNATNLALQRGNIFG